MENIRKTENSETLPKQTGTESFKNPEQISTAEFFGALGLIAGGALIVKKVWDSNVGGIQEKTKTAADELCDAAIQKAKLELKKTFGLEPKQTPLEAKTTPQSLEKTNNTNEVLDDLENLVSDDSTDKQDVEKVLGKSFVDLVDKRDSRFKAIADIDPNFENEIKLLSDKSDEEIMSFIRTLDPTARGLVSAAFLSTGLLMEKENKTEEQVLDEHKGLLDNDEYLKIFMNTLGSLSEKRGVDVSKLSVEDQNIATKEALNQFHEKSSEETYFKEQKEPETDIKIMKAEYMKLLREKGEVQKRLLKMMAEVFRSTK